MPRKKPNKHEEMSQKTFGAVLVIFLGVMLLANNLGLIPAGLVRFWPVLLVILGLLGLSGGLR